MEYQWRNFGVIARLLPFCPSGCFRAFSFYFWDFVWFLYPISSFYLIIVKKYHVFLHNSKKNANFAP